MSRVVRAGRITGRRASGRKRHSASPPAANVCIAQPGRLRSPQARAGRLSSETFRQAIAVGLILEGRREWVRAFPTWFERYLFAAVAPAAPAARAAR